MDAMRHFTENANVVVRFMQSINCLFLQLRWLESNLRTGSNETVILVIILVCFIGYFSLACSGESTTNGFGCGENGVSSLMLMAVIVSILYFLYKRFSSHQNAARVDSDETEREKFIHATVPPFDQISYPGGTTPNMAAGYLV